MPKGDKKTKQDVQIEKQILGIAKELADAIKQQSQNQAEVVRSKKVERDVAGEIAVTNMEYEATIQDKKRQIKVLQPEFVEQFVSEFKRLLKKQQSL